MTAPMMAHDAARPGTGGVRASTLVVGLGQTGLSCVRYLLATGREVSVTDSRVSPPGLSAFREEFPALRTTLGGFDTAQFLDAGEVVLSPGVALVEPAVRHARDAGIPVLGDIELFAQAVRAPVIAVTGSNGKSTVTALLERMARSAGKAVRAGGNLGPPALSLLSDTSPDLYVIELSSFQLETTYSLRPLAATVLNLSPDHMDRYPDVAAYARAKKRIFRDAGAMVINADDPRVTAMREPGREVLEFTLGAAGPRTFGIRERRGIRWLARDNTALMPTHELALPGAHNVSNVLAALALGEAAGLPMEAMLSAARRFTGLAHRCELVTTADQVRWYNDSKGTNVGATIAAIAGLGADAPVVLIAGGDGKGADFSPLREPLAEHVATVVLFGRDAPLLAEAIGDIVPLAHAATLEEAVALARAQAGCGDIVLFSPACASFDMYPSYVHRGEAFRAAVLQELG